MFGANREAEQFVKTLQKLSDACEGKKPANLVQSVNRILARTEGFSGGSIEQLISFIADPPKASPTTQRKKSKVRAFSPKLVDEIVSKLRSLQNDKAQFDAYADQVNKTCDAKTVKVAAAAFSRSDQPGKKGEALELIKRTRGNFVRADHKSNVSEKARPW